MAVAPGGTGIGAVDYSTGGTTSFSPSWGTGNGGVTIVGDLLVLWIYTYTANNLSSVTSGWTQAPSTDTYVYIYYKVAAGGDAAPTLTLANYDKTWAMLGEFSGTAASSPNDSTGTGPGSGGSTQVVSNAAADSAAGDLIVAVTYWNGSNVGGTVTNTMTGPGGMADAVTATAFNSNDGIGAYFNAAYGVGVSSGSTPDSATANISVFNGGNCVIASFKSATGYFSPSKSTSRVVLRSGSGNTINIVTGAAPARIVLRAAPAKPSYVTALHPAEATRRIVLRAAPAKPAAPFGDSSIPLLSLRLAKRRR